MTYSIWVKENRISDFLIGNLGGHLNLGMPYIGAHMARWLLTFGWGHAEILSSNI